MIIARPMGILRSALFFCAFTTARIPLWFVLVSVLINGFITPLQAIVIISAIVICRSYIESEIAGCGFLLFTVLRTLRFFMWVIIIIGMYAILLYYALAAEPLDKALIAVALIIVIYLYNGSSYKNGYWNGYRTPVRVTVITSLLWLYLSFIPDNLFGNITVLTAIYIIEFFNLINDAPLTGFNQTK